jgi:N-methylhydantoinase A
LVADVKRDFIQPLNLNLSTQTSGDTDESIRHAARELARQATEWFESQRSEAGSEPVVELSADMRFSGQAFTIPVALGTDSETDQLNATKAATLFRRAYNSYYDTDNPDAKVQLVSLRATLVCASDELILAETSDASAGQAARIGTRDVRLPGFDGACGVYQRSALTVGDKFTGPAIVEQYDTTALIPSGFDVEVDETHNLIARKR